MKKLLIIILSVFLALSAAGCAKAKNEMESAAQSMTQSEASRTESKAESESENKAESKTESEDSNTEIANPWTDYDNAEEAAKNAGFDTKFPESIAGSNEKVIRVLKDSITEIIYKGGDGEVTLRKGKGDSDISGDYTRYTDEKTTTVSGKEVSLKGEGDKISLATWTEGNFSFSVYFDKGTDENTITSVVNQLS